MPNIPANPFSELRIQLVHTGKPAGIATRIAHCVIAAKNHQQTLHLLGVLDADGGFMCDAYTEAFRGHAFRSDRGWHHDYDRLRCHALSYLDTRRAVAA